MRFWSLRLRDYCFRVEDPKTTSVVAVGVIVLVATYEDERWLEEDL
jgi:hypothetical protein